MPSPDQVHQLRIIPVADNYFLWVDGRPFEAAELPLDKQLVAGLERWFAAYSSDTEDWTDDEFAAEGRRLSAAVQDALGSQWIVSFDD